MTSPTLKTFHVHFDTWSCLGRTFEAETMDGAIAQAKALYEQEGENAFDLVNSGSEPFQAYEFTDHPMVKAGQS